MFVSSYERFINERMKIVPLTDEEFKRIPDDMMAGDTVRLELSSATYDCIIGDHLDYISLMDTNEWIYGKTVDKFKGDDSEIVWDLDIKSGKIKGWEGGSAYIAFKVVDNGIYTLMNKNRIVAKKVHEYVPEFLQIDDKGYGDYVYITISDDGSIKDWDDKRRKQVFEFFSEK